MRRAIDFSKDIVAIAPGAAGAYRPSEHIPEPVIVILEPGDATKYVFSVVSLPGASRHFAEQFLWPMMRMGTRSYMVSHMHPEARHSWSTVVSVGYVPILLPVDADDFDEHLNPNTRRAAAAVVNYLIGVSYERNLAAHAQVI